MKTMRFLLLTGTIIMTTIPCTVVQSQDKDNGSKADPDVKWEVRKEYDENGNLIYYDSSCVHSWKHFDFPGPGIGHAFDDFDSLFEHRPFAFGPFSELMDSLDLDFYLDSSIFRGPQGFRPFTGSPDSIWMDSFFPDSLFPDAFMPFEEFFPPSFHGPDVFFDRHKEWIERFREEFTFPVDSLNHVHPKWHQLPRQQKKPARSIEI